MKTGRDIQSLAQEITRRAANKRDYIAPTEGTELVAVDGQGIAMRFGDVDLAINGIAHDQIGIHTNIPAAYYDRMLAEAPDLLATNVNRWFREKPAKRMVRTLDGTARAFLSDKYRPMENEEMAEAILPVLQNIGAVIMSAEVTDRRLYIKAVDRKILKDVPTGKRIGDGSHVFFDTLSPAIVFSNSEVGLGSLSIETAVYTKVCTNLATIPAAGSLRKYHTGSKHELGGDDAYRLLSDTTRRLDDAALWSRVRDIAKAAFEPARFESLVDEHIVGMTQQPIAGEVVKVVELTAKRFSMTEGEGKSVLQHLAAGGDLTRYGLFNAITRTAEDIADYDRATEFERMGGKLIELGKGEWQKIAEAA